MYWFLSLASCAFLLFAAAAAMIPSCTSVVGSGLLAAVTGATGTLGQALCRSLTTGPAAATVFGSYRSMDKAKQMIDSYKLSNTKCPKMFLLDVGSANSMVAYDVPGFGTCFQQSHKVLFNNAAVCYHHDGNVDKSVQLSSLVEHLHVNAYYPIRLAQCLLEQHRSRSEHSPLISIVNVSSGDGEVAFLNTRIATDIAGIHDLSGLFNYIHKLQLYLEDMDPYDFAHSSTPFYSVSKALLNCGTRLLHEEFCSASSGRRIISVCPGNFASDMSTSEELVTAIDVDDAAERLVSMATKIPQFPSGFFYRNFDAIPW